MSAGPLEGIRVLDFGSFITGPFAAMLLADLGAEVIKLERPDTGDPFRSFDRGLYGPQFRAFNRNKKSVAVDLDSEEDRRLVRRLVAQADVLVENGRPGAMARRGLDHAAVEAIAPRLVYCSITGFGATGVDALRPAYDTVAQAASGYLSLFVSPGDTTIKGPAVADVVTGLYAANGVLAALVRRGVTGRGGLLEVNMMNAVAHFASEPFQHYFERGTPPAPAHRSHISQSFAFACADGRLLAVHLSSPEKFWTGLLAATGRPELGTDPRFATRRLRIENYGALEAELAGTFATRTLEEWAGRLLAHDVPHAPVRTLAEVLEDPHARWIGLESRGEHPVEGTVRGIASPLLFGGVRPVAFTPPPTLDEHGAEIRARFAAADEA